MLFAEKYHLRLRLKIPDTEAIKVAYRKRNQMDIIATTSLLSQERCAQAYTV